MAAKERRFPLFTVFIAAMCLLLLIGLFLLIYGSLHHTVPMPTLKGPGMYAMAAPHGL